MSTISTVNRAFHNSAAFRITAQEVAAPKPLQDLSRLSFTMFSAVGSEEGPAAVNLRIGLWRLRTAAIHAVFPFEQLDLGASLDQISAAAMVFPLVRDYVSALRRLVDQMSIETNPKEEALDVISSRYAGTTFGLVAPDSRAAWAALAAHRFPAATLIRGLQSLNRVSFPLLVLPSGGHRCPLWSRMVHGYPAPEVHLLHYRFERLNRRVPPVLPLAPRAERIAPIPVLAPPPVEPDDFDPFEGSTSWSSLRKQYAVQGAGANDFLVPARGLILGDSKRTFLAEDKEVIELSQALAQGRPSFDKLPRKPVRHLQPGDLIVLRTRGSGDYLQDVVKQLLVRDNAATLRVKALEWKDYLAAVLRRVGPTAFCETLRTHGHDMRHNSRYVWLWATDEVMRPHSLKIFRALIGAIAAVALPNPLSNTSDEAVRIWNLMNELLRYHLRAGAIIRRALLHRLSDLAGSDLGDESHITLEGLRAGELTLFRVHAVEPQAVMTPYSATGAVHPADHQAPLWHT
jgi:hypothetical protein